jgi:tungstate transport system permease protein
LFAHVHVRTLRPPATVLTFAYHDDSSIDEGLDVSFFHADIWSIVGLSLWVSTTAVLLAAVIGIPAGVWLGHSGRRLRSAASLVAQTGMALPPVVVGLLVYLLLSRSGPLGFLEWLFTPNAMILAQVVLALPWVLGITIHSVAAVPPAFVLQIRSLGASPWQTRWAVLREARAGLALAVAAALGRSLSEVGAVLMVGGNIQGQTRVLTTAIVLETSRGQFGLALALATWLLALALVLNLIIFRLQGRPIP